MWLNNFDLKVHFTIIMLINDPGRLELKNSKLGFQIKYWQICPKMKQV